MASDRMPDLASKTVLWKLAAILGAALLLGVIWVSINPFSSLTVDPICHRIEVHWKGRDGKILGDLGRLKAHIEDSQNKLGRRKLLLGMNAGMFLATPQGHPMGLLVVHGQTDCSPEEQQHIVSELESKFTICDKIEETIRQSLQQAETLRQSILKKAFEGKLVANK